jgi:hypothetical protein
MWLSQKTNVSLLMPDETVVDAGLHAYSGEENRTGLTKTCESALNRLGETYLCKTEVRLSYVWRGQQRMTGLKAVYNCRHVCHSTFQARS